MLSSAGQVIISMYKFISKLVDNDGLPWFKDSSWILAIFLVRYQMYIIGFEKYDDSWESPEPLLWR